MSSSSGAGQREVAYRVFAAEYADADLDHKESDEERAPNYVVTPTGARVNRVFVVGVLTEVESVSEGVLRARVVDPTGAFVCYAGQYQPDEQAFLERAEPPIFVAMTGKARTFSPEDSDRIFTSVRPEAINEVDADTRDRWTVQTAEQTIDRIRAMAGALALEQRGEALRELLAANDVDDGLAAGIPLALAHYGTTPAYLAALAEVAIEATQLVAGDRDAVDATTVQPAAAGEGDLPVEPREFAVPADDEGASPEAVSAAETAGSEPSTVAGDAEQTEDIAEQGDEVATTSDAEAGDADAEAAAEPAGGAGDAAPAAGETVDSPAAPTEASPAEAGAAEPTEGDGTDAEVTEGPGDFEPGSYDLDEDERAAVEDEFGTEFQSGAEVDEPGAADIETPGPDEGVDPETEEPAAEPDADDGDTEGTAGDLDLEDAAVDAMAALDDGDGAPRSAVIERVVEHTGATEAAVEEAIQAALMDGRCYEPADDHLQAI